MTRTYPPAEVALEKCTGCGLCIEVCPSFVLELMDEKAGVVRAEWCSGCGHCGAVCPTEAIRHQATAAEGSPQPGPAPATTAETLLLLLRERRSARIYRDKPVPDELLERILDAGRYAPTGTNSQNVHYILLRSPNEISRLRNMTMAFYEKVFGRVRGRIGRLIMTLIAGRRMVEYLRQALPKAEHAKRLMDQGKDRLLYHAPVVTVVHAESWDSCSPFNCAAALYHCSLMAHTLGLGCCFNWYVVNAINNDRSINRWLGIPRNHRCFGAMTLGYPKVRFDRLTERDPAKVTWR